MNPLRSVGTRLSLALLVVVAGALAIVYAVLVPSLQRNLVDAKVAQVDRAARSLAVQIPTEQYFWHGFIENAAGTANAGIALLDYLQPPPDPTLIVIDNSSNIRSAGLASDPIALEAARTLTPHSGSSERAERRYADAAVPIETGQILLLTAPLDDTLATVAQVRRRILVAGGIALVFSLALGYGGAWVFARRIRRLERAADRIAGGRFDEPVSDPGRDEVGELAAAFERMRRRLARLDHARREFIANASHELRTPVFSLGGFIELLTDEELDEATRREFLEAMREQVGRLGKLATDLLDLSRLDAGRLQVAREALDLRALAVELAEEFEPLARTREHGLEVETDGPARALGDEQRVFQIGRILLENAIVHTPPGTPVRIRARANGDRAELAVEDEGPGIPSEHAAQVFERFYRIDGNRASGSGLGLAIARELAELMGGTITLTSTEGETRFALVLPATSGEQATEPTAVHAGS